MLSSLPSRLTRWRNDGLRPGAITLFSPEDMRKRESAGRDKCSEFAAMRRRMSR